MRQRANVDSNQAEVVKALRSIGASVQHLHQVGKGCPDLLVGYRGQNFLLEVKDGNKPASARQLTPDEQRWAEAWAGQVCVVKTARGAVDFVQQKTGDAYSQEKI